MPHQLERAVATHLRVLVDHIPSHLAYVDRELRCRFANRSFERLLPNCPADVSGLHIQEFLGPQLYAQNRPYMDAALKGVKQVFERVLTGPDGTTRRAVANYVPHVVEGSVMGFFVHVIEITRLKQVQEALEREQKLRAQLQIQTEKLAALLRERDAMLDVLAHEVRQPLNTASAALSMAARAFAEIEQTDTAVKLERAQDFVGEILTRVDNSLTVATLLARAACIDTADTDMDTLLALAVGDMPEAQRGRISIVRSTPTRTVLMDMSLMRIALRNLLSNALNFSPACSGVEVHLSESDAPLAFVIDVSNSGGGIAEDQINALFYKAERPSPADSGKRQGLGLYIVRRIMELHGGSASLLRNGASGTSFRLVLPPIEPD